MARDRHIRVNLRMCRLHTRAESMDSAKGSLAQGSVRSRDAWINSMCTSVSSTNMSIILAHSRESAAPHERIVGGIDVRYHERSSASVLASAGPPCRPVQQACEVVTPFLHQHVVAAGRACKRRGWHPARLTSATRRPREAQRHSTACPRCPPPPRRHREPAPRPPFAAMYVCMYVCIHTFQLPQRL